MRNRRRSSTNLLTKQIAQLSKGAQQIVYKIVLLIEKITTLQAALDESNKRKSRKRRYVQTEETLTVGKVQKVLAKQAGSSRGNGKSASKRVREERRYRRYK